MKIVTAGIICHKDKILIAQRKLNKSLGGLWEFPGGKLEEGETLEQCLKREIWEELHLEISIKKFFMKSDFSYDFGTISLNAFFAESPTQQIDYMDSHEAIRWVSISELKNYEFPPADKPIIEKLEQTGLIF